MTTKNRFGATGGGWIQKSDGAALALRVRDFLAGHSSRVQTSFVAQALGVERAAAYGALTQLHGERMVTRRPDARGRVWWAPREDVGLVRKERIVFALERASDGTLPTSALCRAWGERDVRRGYVVLRYYREIGLIEAVSEGVGAEASWRIKK